MKVTSLVALMSLATCGLVQAQTKEEIRIGQTMPYSGPLSPFGVMGRVQEAFFAKVNAEGGVNGKKIKFISADDGYSPPKTVEQTRRLVEQDDVAVMFGSLGTSTNNSVHRYLNGRKVPQLFVLSGATKWADPKKFPYTMPGMATYESEGIIYAKYILRTKPDARIAILSLSDDFGRDYIAGLKRGLGAKAEKMIVATATFEAVDPTINSQLAMLKNSGANVMFGVTAGKFTSQLVKGMAEIGWKPDMTFIPLSASSITFLEPAGLENAIGFITSGNQKDVLDPQWANDDDVKAFYSFMKQYMPEADTRNTNYAAGYGYANLMLAVLKKCGNDFSSENIMRAAYSLKNLKIPLLLPGVTISTSSDDYLPFQQLQLRRFDGKSWIAIGEILDDQ